jgi:hypothetical protein
MKRKYKTRASCFQRRRTIRLSETEDARLMEEAAFAGITVAEYMRRRLWGGRPVLARADVNTVRELRRMGGLLKNNFETLRQARMEPGFINRHEELLLTIAEHIQAIGRARDDREENQKQEYDKTESPADR